MARRLVDISVAIDDITPADPPFMMPSITYHGHAEGAAPMAGIFQGLSPDDLPDGEGWAAEEVKLTILQRLPRHGVEGAERLVHQQHLRLLRQRPRDLQPLLHAAGHLRRVFIAVRAQPHAL